jgi:serine/threonine-protein kinase RsbW
MSARTQHTCQLTIPAQLASLEEIHDLVASLWERQTRFPPADRLRFETAVIEVAGNIVAHAAAGQSGGREVTVELALTVSPESATACFHDDGGAAELDLASARMPDTLAECGRGIALTRALADDLTYERSRSANIWTLTCRRADPGGTADVGPGRPGGKG